jgi:hypothetical protein
MAGGRIRTLKPEILDDEKVAPLSDTAFRLFTSMVILADDWGNVRADVRWLQAQIWWAHKEPPNTLPALLELSRSSLIDVYAVRGGTYVHLRGWEKHQRIDNRGKARVPTPNDATAQAVSLSEVCEETPFANFRGNPPRNSAGSGEEKEEEGIEDVAAEPPLTKPIQSDSTKRKHRIPADWQPREQERQSAASKGLDCDSEAEHFRDHHTAKGEPMLDWDAAFRTWLKNAVKFGRAKQQGSFLNAPTRAPLEELK